MTQPANTAKNRPPHVATGEVNVGLFKGWVLCRTLQKTKDAHFEGYRPGIETQMFTFHSCYSNNPGDPSSHTQTVQFNKASQQTPQAHGLPVQVLRRPYEGGSQIRSLGDSVRFLFHCHLLPRCWNIMWAVGGVPTQTTSSIDGAHSATVRPGPPS